MVQATSGSSIIFIYFHEFFSIKTDLFFTSLAGNFQFKISQIISVCIIQKKQPLASINLCVLPSYSGLHLHISLGVGSANTLFQKRTANIRRMRANVLESGFRNFDSQYELKRVSNSILFSGYFQASINVCNNKFVAGLFIFNFCIH